MNSQSSDLVNVQLTPDGVANAKGGPMSVHGGGVELTFTAGVPQPVHITVWNETLKTISPFGKPWFMLAPAAAGPDATTTSAK